MTTDDTMTHAYQIKEKKTKLQTNDGPITKRSFKNIKINAGICCACAL